MIEYVVIEEAPAHEAGESCPSPAPYAERGAEYPYDGWVNAMLSLDSNGAHMEMERSCAT